MKDEYGISQEREQERVVWKGRVFLGGGRASARSEGGQSSGVAVQCGCVSRGVGRDEDAVSERHLETRSVNSDGLLPKSIGEVIALKVFKQASGVISLGEEMGNRQGKYPNDR